MRLLLYFQKYGRTYEAVLQAKKEDEDIDKLQVLDRAKEFISSFGKADHLMSLLLFQKYLISGVEGWKDYSVYEYKLTSME